jgi:hypothetical protein
MDEVKQEDSLDRQLREAAPYIDDDGFTKRVLQKLPASRSTRRPSRAVILLGISIIASALAYLISDGGRFINEIIARLASLPTLWLLILASGIGILMSVIGLVAALSRTRELQS